MPGGEPRKQLPWFRLWTRKIHDGRIRRLSYAHRWLYVAAYAAARESPEPGRLLIAEGFPMNTRELAEYAGMPLRECQKGLAVLRELGLVGFGEDDAIRILDWELEQYASDDVTARTRKHRERSRERSKDVPGNGPEYRDRGKSPIGLFPAGAASKRDAADRARRLAQAGELIPPPELNPAEANAWILAERRRLADGEQIPEDTRGQLRPRNITRALTKGKT